MSTKGNKTNKPKPGKISEGRVVSNPAKALQGTKGTNSNNKPKSK